MPSAAHAPSFTALSFAELSRRLGSETRAKAALKWLYRDGLPIAALSGGKVEFLATLEGASQWDAEKTLMRSAARGQLADLA